MAAKRIKITAELIPQAEGGFTVWCPELDIYTQGETERECLASLREAATLHLGETPDRMPARLPVRRRTIQLTLP